MKKRILCITPLPPPVHGSAIVSENIQKSAFINSKYDMDFVNLSTSRTVEEIQKKSLSLTIVKAFRFACSFFRTFFLLSTRHYDACYLAITCHGVPFLKDAPFVLLCKLFRRKIVIHQHNKGMSQYVGRFPYNWLLPCVYRNVTVILLSEYLFNDVSQVVKREQVMICPNGIECEINHEIEHDTPGKKHLLFLSNLLIAKGVYVLLDALVLLKNRNIDFKCDFVGGITKDLNADSFAHAVDERSLSDVVFYHGARYGADKQQFLLNSSVFVLPTLDDCFGLVLLEAMQYSLPVVSTDEGGIPDIISEGKTGFICRKNDPETLADTLERLIKDDKLCKSLGSEGYKRFMEQFTIDCFEKRFVECINEAIS